MKLRKWNYKTGKYDPYEVPDYWNVSTFETDMNTIVNCAECGRAIMFAYGYTSRKIHTRYGMGYAVCGNCYSKEVSEELKSRQQEEGNRWTQWRENNEKN